VPSLIRKELKPYKGPILFAEHHMSHAASCFLVSPFRGGGHPHRGRRGRMGHRVLRRGPRHRHHALQGDPLPAQPGPALQRLHLLPRLQGEQRRVQGHGPGPLREAGPLRPDHEGDDPPQRGRLLQARHEVLLVRLRPDHDQRAVQRVLRRPAPQARDLDDRARVRHRGLRAEGLRGGRARMVNYIHKETGPHRTCAWRAAWP
jgi:hypothetical protein